MIVDSSALVALLMDESSARRVESALAAADRIGISAATLVEATIVLSSRMGRDARPVLARLMRLLDAEVVPFDEGQYEYAVDGWLRFGKGRHKAALDLGDCLSYAAARYLDQPLLCVGDDFAQTDVAIVPLGG